MIDVIIFLVIFVVIPLTFDKILMTFYWYWVLDQKDRSKLEKKDYSVII